MNAMRVGELKRRVRRYRWYVEPKNQHTNERISALSSEEDIYFGRICSDGKPHDLFEVQRQLVDFLARSKTSQPELAFSIWTQEGHGLIKPWYLQKKSARVRKIVGQRKPVPASSIAR